MLADALLQENAVLFLDEPLKGPVLDLASGECRNGIFLAQKGVEVICCDISSDLLKRAKEAAARLSVDVAVWQLDLEREGLNPLPEDFFGGILVFRYLHRPLMPCIKKALKEDGILLYETYTIEQSRLGKPHNPCFLLKPGELITWFRDWKIIHSFEGIKENPPRAIAQIACKKTTQPR